MCFWNYLSFIRKDNFTLLKVFEVICGKFYLDYPVLDRSNLYGIVLLTDFVAPSLLELASCKVFHDHFQFGRKASRIHILSWKSSKCRRGLVWWILWLIYEICNVNCFFFSGGIVAGYISDKSKCSGITCFVMLIIAAPMVWPPFQFACFISYFLPRELIKIIVAFWLCWNFLSIYVFRKMKCFILSVIYCLFIISIFLWLSVVFI